MSTVLDLYLLKQNKLLPVTRLKVWSLDKVLRQHLEGIKVYVMNSNYIDETR